MKKQALRFILMMAIAIGLIFGSVPRAGLAAGGEGISGGAGKPAALTRIRFDSGGTSAAVSAHLGANGRTRYVLRARVRQLMEVTLTGPDGASLVVRRRNGRILSAATETSTSFRGYLPNSGDYILDVYTSARGGDYTLFVSIPERISFEANTTSGIVEGELSAHESHEYILRAGAGQVMDVDVSVSGAATDTDGATGVQLVIYGVDGSVLRSGMSEGSSFRGELPLSQDYLVVLRAGDQAVEYSLNVIIPRRISFARGAYSASDNRRVKAFSSLYYVVRAGEGQTMTVDVSGNKPVRLIVYGVDGEVLQSGMGDADNFQGKLPSTQDYILVVKAGEVGSSYKIVVTIK